MPVKRRSPIEVVSSNGVVIRQVVSRILARPDILISARDLGVALYVPVIGDLVQPGFVNTGATLDGAAEGPGNVEPQSGYTFSKVGVYSLNRGNTDEQDGQPGNIWGSLTEAPMRRCCIRLAANCQTLKPRLST